MKKIGELKGKPIIEGNPNEVKNNQIHIKTDGEGGITLSERKNGNLETIIGGADDDFLSYRYFRDKTEIEGKTISVTEFLTSVFRLLLELEGRRPYTLSLPFIIKIAEADSYIPTDKKYQIKFIDIMYDKEKLNDFEVLGIMIPKYLNITIVSSAPSFGNIYPEYNMPFFDCVREIAQFIDGGEGIEFINTYEKAISTAEITREEFLTIGN